MTSAALLVASILYGAVTPVTTSDPFQRAALSVIRNPQGAPRWKVDLMVGALKRGVSAHHRLRLTYYCYHCAGRICADGSPVRHGVCAFSTNVPRHSIVWVEGNGLRLCTDVGGAIHTRQSAKYGFRSACDIWVPDCCTRRRWKGSETRQSVPWALVMVGDGMKNRNSNRHPVNDFERALSTY